VSKFATPSVLAAALVACLAFCAQAAVVSVPVANASFENPDSLPFGGIFPAIDDWDEAGPIDADPPPFPGFEVPPGGPFRLDTGVFFNSMFLSDGLGGFFANPGFVTNAHGNQLGYIFARAGLLIDENTLDPIPDTAIALSQQLLDVYTPGLSYNLTIGIGKSYFLPPDLFGVGAQLGLALFYVDDNGDIVILSETLIGQDDVLDDELTDFSVLLDEVDAADDHAGKAIGILIDPRIGMGGVWIYDNVRLTAEGDLGGGPAVPEPATASLALMGLLACLRRRR
jgi:hypothetical protein